MSITDGVKAGRPMDGRRDSAILSAALELIGELGYERVTMDAIAARCHASKATIYRRWDSKATLVIDALKERKRACAYLPDTGDLRNDLLAGLQNMVDSASEEDLHVYSGLLTASRSDPELGRLLREVMVIDKRTACRAWTTSAVNRGHLPPDVEGDIFYEIAPAVVFMRLLVTGEPVDRAYLVHMVDDILMPLLTYRAGSAACPDGPKSSPDPVSPC